MKTLTTQDAIHASRVKVQVNTSRRKPVLKVVGMSIELTKLQKLPPFSNAPFAWDDMTLPHKLIVTIEGFQKEYSLDDIKDHEPIELRKNPVETKEIPEDESSLKKGILLRKGLYEEEYREYYCVLSVLKQMLKIYEKKTSTQPIKINLKEAKIDDLNDQEFIILCSRDAKDRKSTNFYFFKARNDREAIEWMTAINAASRIKDPNVVYVKIEPVQSTKVITFHTTRNDKISAAETLLATKPVE